MNVADNIKKYRKLAGLTQRELAEKCSCAIGTIQQYEANKRQPRLEQLQEIAFALNTSVAALTDTGFAISKNWGFDDHPIIVNGIISPEILNIRKELEVCKELPFTVLTDSEKLSVYYNSLNDEGQEKAFELLELLLEIKRYRRNLKNDENF